MPCRPHGHHHARLTTSTVIGHHPIAMKRLGGHARVNPLLQLCFCRPGAGSADRDLPRCGQPPAGLLQPDAPNHKRDGWSGRNRPVDHDRWHPPGGRLLSRHRGRLDRRPGVRSRPADSRRPGWHRHRYISGTRERFDAAAPCADRTRRCHHSGMAGLRRPARGATTADLERLRLRRRDRRVRRPARLAPHRDPGGQPPGPGRAADVIAPDLVAVVVAVALRRASACGRSTAAAAPARAARPRSDHGPGAWRRCCGAAWRPCSPRRTARWRSPAWTGWSGGSAAP